MVHVFVGTNWFAMQSALQSIETEFLKKHDPFSVVRLQAQDTDANSVIEALAGVSLFSTAKLVILKDLSANKSLLEKAEDIIAAGQSTSDIVIIETTIDKRSSYFKLLKKQPGYVEFNELNEQQLRTWVAKYAKERGGNISMADASYLMTRVGLNQTVLEREVTKLVQYSSDINRPNIDQLTEQTLNSTIFQLVDSVFTGNIQSAIRLYDEQRSQRVEPQAILGMLIWQMHAIAVCLAGGSRSAQAIAAEAGMSPYVIQKTQPIARKMGLSRLNELVDMLRDIEVTSKRQTYNLDDALKLAILKLA